MTINITDVELRLPRTAFAGNDQEIYDAEEKYNANRIGQPRDRPNANLLVCLPASDWSVNAEPQPVLHRRKMDPSGECP